MLKLPSENTFHRLLKDMQRSSPFKIIIQNNVFNSSPNIVMTTLSFCQSHVRIFLCFNTFFFITQLWTKKKPTKKNTPHLLLDVLVKVRIHYWFVCLHHNLCSIISSPTHLVNFFFSYSGLFRLPNSTSFSFFHHSSLTLPFFPLAWFSCILYGVLLSGKYTLKAILPRRFF